MFRLIKAMVEWSQNIGTIKAFDELDQTLLTKRWFGKLLPLSGDAKLEALGKVLDAFPFRVEEVLGKARVAFQGGVWARLIEKVEAFIMGSGRTENAGKVEGRMEEGG